MEGTVHCRNMWMETQCVTHCLESYSKNKSHLLHGQDYYLNQKLASLSSTIYNYFLIDYKDLLSEQELIKFDNSIKTLTPDLYRKLDECTIRSRFFNFHYIRHWRKKGTRNSVRFKLLDVFFHLKKAIKRS